MPTKKSYKFSLKLLQNKIDLKLLRNLLCSTTFMLTQSCVPLVFKISRKINYCWYKQSISHIRTVLDNEFDLDE